MKIPKTLKVAGHNYKVLYDDKYLSKANQFGQCDFVTQKIRLAKHAYKRVRAKSDIDRTLYHEIVHAIDGHYNNFSLSEKVVDRLSNGLYQVLADNFIIKPKRGTICLGK
jgi:hypothetical protein